MFEFFKKKKEVIEQSPKQEQIKTEAEKYDLPPIGAMFSDNDRPEDQHFMKVIGYKKSDYRKEPELRLENFPMTSVFYCDFSWSFTKERYTRLTPEQEEKWNKEYFADKQAYWKNKEEGYKKEAQDRVDAEANAIKERIDNAHNKYVVIYCGNAISFEKMLNYATHKLYRVMQTAMMPNGVFVAIMVKE